MQFSENWLRQYVNPELNSEALGHVLTMAGLEVETLTPVAAVFSQVVVAQILSAEKHPDADRLQVCKVDVGQGEPLQIVCGAPNARAGLKAPCALVGANLPGFAIKQAKVRGVESFGMMCSAKELGLSEESSGLLELPVDAPVGQDIRTFLDLDDQIFTLKLTPNRSDCLSMTGIARDVAALAGATLQLPEIQNPAIAHDRTLAVTVEASTACPRYVGRLVSNVNANAATPDWMQQRLERSGIRSISAIVDITNYVLLELGQPMHAFDAAKLTGGIHVRYAQPSEKLELLNQQTIELTPDMLVIADENGAIALAGIMGGATTAVSDSTTDIFLESAFFTPAVMAGKARRLGLSTDSSYRFERGVDFGNTLRALERATALVLDICGGEAGPATEVLGDLPARNSVKLRMQRVCGVLGIELEQAVVAKLFTQLGFAYTYEDGVFDVTPPSYRFDIEIEEDLIEEVARLHGYDHIPATPPTAALRMLDQPETLLSRATLRQLIAASGYQEMVGYSFVDQVWERNLQGNEHPIRLLNPIASNMDVMRTGLWGGLLDALVYNLNRKQERVRLFEIGATYHAQADGSYHEIQRIAGLAYGDIVPEQWASESREVDFFDTKADVDLLTQGQATYQVAAHPALHPGQSAQVILDGAAIGWLGKLHPKWQQHYQLPRSAILFELDLAPLLFRKLVRYAEVAKFPPVRRDMAVVVDADVSVQALLNTMRATRLPLVSKIELFDMYCGKGIAEGKKSLAFLVLMQDTQKTLTDAEADEVMAKLLDSVVRTHNAELR
jgi:phenylalanyl-tRNA synthetase beta chain